MQLLSIESSCDECSAAVVSYSEGNDWVQVQSVSTFSQEKIHAPFGGVVPEVASRNHLETIHERIDNALKEAGVQAQDLDAVAVTSRPGLVGALLVGVSAAKALAYALKKPLVPVHHLEGHAASVFLSDEISAAPGRDLEYPLLLAIVSGGHTQLHKVDGPPQTWPRDFLKTSLVGRSRDDAAGEAFDKTAKLLGFPYPGGVWIDRVAQTAQKDGRKAFHLPRALPQKAVLDYSFSGFKTAVALLADRLKQEGRLEESLPDLCASIQEAIVDALLGKMALAIEKYGCKSLAVVGGVAANSRLRGRLETGWSSMGLSRAPIYPPLRYCTDNAAMIGGIGAFRLSQGLGLDFKEMLALNAQASAEF